jgi:hypothetical protein
VNGGCGGDGGGSDQAKQKQSYKSVNQSFREHHHSLTNTRARATHLEAGHLLGPQEDTACASRHFLLLLLLLLLLFGTGKERGAAW